MAPSSCIAPSALQGLCAFLIQACYIGRSRSRQHPVNITRSTHCYLSSILRITCARDQQPQLDMDDCYRVPRLRIPPRFVGKLGNSLIETSLLTCGSDIGQYCCIASGWGVSTAYQRLRITGPFGTWLQPLCMGTVSLPMLLTSFNERLTTRYRRGVRSPLCPQVCLYR